MNGFTAWWRTVGVLIGLELRQRTRATRWRVLLGVFFAFVSAVVFGSLWFTTTTGGDSAYRDWSENLYLIVLGFVGFLGLVISPTMTATSINGDRKDATLAVVQATPASGLQIALGKLLGAWLASSALLLVCGPYIVWGIAAANYPLWSALLGVVMIALLFLTYCGIGLGFSALLSRPIGSAALTQLTMLSLLIGLPIVAVMLVPTTESTVMADRPTWDYNSDTRTSTCRIERTEVTVTHTERVWWIVAPNPAVVLADAAAQRDYGRDAEREARPRRYADYTNQDTARPPSESALGHLADTVSEFRTAPDSEQDAECGPRSRGFGDDIVFDTGSPRYLGHTWYWGLLANLVLGGIGLAVAARRLRVPAGKLPRGVRIA